MTGIMSIGRITCAMHASTCGFLCPLHQRTFCAPLSHSHLCKIDCVHALMTDDAEVYTDEAVDDVLDQLTTGLLIGPSQAFSDALNLHLSPEKKTSAKD